MNDMSFINNVVSTILGIGKVQKCTIIDKVVARIVQVSSIKSKDANQICMHYFDKPRRPFSLITRCVARKAGPLRNLKSTDFCGVATKCLCPI